MVDCELSDVVLGVVGVLRPLYERGSVQERAEISDAYFRLIDVLYRNDITRQISYKKILYTKR